MDYIITALISYLFGSIPFGYIFTKIFLKKDIRDVGSVSYTHLTLPTNREV